MKRFLAFAALLLSHSPLFAQACHPINVAASAQQKALLQAYLQDCHQRYFLSEQKGAVKLTIYHEADGRTCWLLTTVADDRYRLAPPEHYARLGHDIILVYQGDANGNPLPLAGNAARRAACMREVLENRLAAYDDQPHYTTITDEKGQVKRVKVTQVTGGNSNNDLIIKFNQDGTVSKFTPV